MGKQVQMCVAVIAGRTTLILDCFDSWTASTAELPYLSLPLYSLQGLTRPLLHLTMGRTNGLTNVHYDCDLYLAAFAANKHL